MTAQTITFSPPLPCVTVHGETQCGKDATVANVFFTGGGYLILPFCRECARALASVYLDDKEHLFTCGACGRETPILANGIGPCCFGKD